MHGNCVRASGNGLKTLRDGVEKFPKTLGFHFRSAWNGHCLPVPRSWDLRLTAFLRFIYGTACECEHLAFSCYDYITWILQHMHWSVRKCAVLHGQLKHANFIRMKNMFGHISKKLGVQAYYSSGIMHQFMYFGVYRDAYGKNPVMHTPWISCLCTMHCHGPMPVL